MLRPAEREDNVLIAVFTIFFGRGSAFTFPSVRYALLRNFFSYIVGAASDIPLPFRVRKYIQRNNGVADLPALTHSSGSQCRRCPSERRFSTLWQRTVQSGGRRRRRRSLSSLSSTVVTVVVDDGHGRCQRRSSTLLSTTVLLDVVDKCHRRRRSLSSFTVIVINCRNSRRWSSSSSSLTVVVNAVNIDSRHLRRRLSRRLSSSMVVIVVVDGCHHRYR